MRNGCEGRREEEPSSSSVETAHRHWNNSRLWVDTVCEIPKQASQENQSLTQVDAVGHDGKLSQLVSLGTGYRIRTPRRLLCAETSRFAERLKAPLREGEIARFRCRWHAEYHGTATVSPHNLREDIGSCTPKYLLRCRVFSVCPRDGCGKQLQARLGLWDYHSLQSLVVQGYTSKLNGAAWPTR